MAAIGFIGLGNMGAPMAANLVRAGHAVRGFDPVPAARDAAAAAGVSIAGSAADAVSAAEIVITMLPAGPHVLAAYADLVAAARAGTLFIDCSTIDIADARVAHALAATAGFAALDAPVSGGTAGAAAGTLTFMVGGDPRTFDRATPILAAMGRKSVPCGGPGAGQAAKACNNMILGISMIAVSEAFVLAEALGLSHQALFDVASASSGQCWSLTSYCPVPGPVPASPANDGYRPGFAAALMLKDLRLATAAAERAGVDAALGRAAEDIFARVDGALDFSAVVLDVRAGVKRPA